MDPKMTAQLASLQSQLNAPGLVEGKWYRPSHVAYELICYINNITALHASKNYGTIPLFIDRAQRYLSSSKAETVSEEYRRVAACYLSQMEKAVEDSANQSNAT
jgi:hypothetical protein